MISSSLPISFRYDLPKHFRMTASERETVARSFRVLAVDIDPDLSGLLDEWLDPRATITPVTTIAGFPDDGWTDEPYDLIVVDVHHPRLHGTESLKRIAPPRPVRWDEGSRAARVPARAGRRNRAGRRAVGHRTGRNAARRFDHASAAGAVAERCGTADFRFDLEKVLWAIHRGAKSNVDMTHQWNFWPLMRLPLDEVRAQIGLLPKLSAA